MGGCFSSESTDYSTGGSNRKPCAHVVSANGQLRQYPLPVTVSEVLRSESSSPESFFVCNSDSLYFDEFIPALEPPEELKPAQIYFVLPTTKLHYRLAASDMAVLAVKASVALEQVNRRSRNRKSRISPVLVAVEDDSQSNSDVNQAKVSSFGSNYYYKSEGSKTPSSAGRGVSRSGSVRKLSKYSSRRAKLAVRSFRIKLNTIYEGSVLLN